MQKLEVLAALIIAAIISYFFGIIPTVTFITGWAYCASFFIAERKETRE